MNPNAKIYKLLETFLGNDFHPPQFICYSSTAWCKTVSLNQNRAYSHDRLDNLIVNCYNVMSLYDLSMCRTAILFLNNVEYYRDKKLNKLRVCRITGNNEMLFDQFHSDCINIDFTNGTEDEKEFVKNFPSEYKSCFEFDYAVCGILYQTGKHVKICSKQKYVEKEKNNRKERLQK